MCGLEFDECSKSSAKYTKMQQQLFYAGLLQPFDKHQYIKKKKVVTAVEHILTESLKQANDITRPVLHFTASLAAMSEIHAKCAQLNEEPGTVPSDSDILALAAALRAIGPHFQAVFLLHTAVTYATSCPLGDSTATPTAKDIDLSALRKILAAHELTVLTIERLRLTNVHALKPLLDGNKIMQLYGCRPGKHLKSLMEECLSYQTLNLDASKEEVEAYMLENKDAFLQKYA